MLKTSPKSASSPKVKSNKKSKSILQKNVPSELHLTEFKNPIYKKLTQTDEYINDHVFTNFQCPFCRITLDSFIQFITHECWREYYLARLDLAETQAFGCRYCNKIFHTICKFDTHLCITDRLFKEVEDAIPITYENHLDFYTIWNDRVKRETDGLETAWKYLCKCNYCGYKFQTKINYFLHSCIYFAQLTTKNIRNFKFCAQCSFVFLDTKQYEDHVQFCNKPKLSVCEDFAITQIQIFCQQFVFGRQCYEFQAHEHQSSTANWNFQSEQKDLTIAVNCFDCDQTYSNLTLYFNHPCVQAGPMITPLQLELVFFCTRCRYILPHYQNLVDHNTSCLGPDKLLFVRLNTPTLLRLALKQWVASTQNDPFLPKRENRLRCGKCNEMFKCFTKLLSHPCPNRNKFEQLLVQPLALLETFVCRACQLVMFSNVEATNHLASNCAIPSLPEIVRLHYTIDEVLIALDVWIRQAQLLQFDFSDANC